MIPKRSREPIEFATPAKRDLTSTERELMRKLFPKFGVINTIDANGKIFLTGGEHIVGEPVSTVYYITEKQLKYARGTERRNEN